MQNFNYSLNDLDYMIPWEREIYLQMLNDELKRKAEIRKQKNG